MKNKLTRDFLLYLVTDRTLIEGKNLLSCIEEAIRGGVTMVQLREKSLSSREFYETALQVKQVTDKYQLPLIINDRLDIALAVDADGLHVGQQDLPAAVTRQLLGSHKLLGVSASTLAEAVQAKEQGADYLGVGAVFPTTTKTDARKVSIHELKEIKEKVGLPVVAIGGINADNLFRVKEAKVDGIAIVSAILGESNIRVAAQRLNNLMKK